MRISNLHKDPKSLAFVTTDKCTASCHNCCFNCKPANNNRLSLKNIIKIIEQIVTNGFWAKSEEFAYSYLCDLHKKGLREINLSTGDEHQKWVPFRNILNACKAAIKLNILVAVNVESTPNMHLLACCGLTCLESKISDLGDLNKYSLKRLWDEQSRAYDYQHVGIKA